MRRAGACKSAWGDTMSCWNEGSETLPPGPFALGPLVGLCVLAAGTAVYFDAALTWIERLQGHTRRLGT